MPMKGNLQDFKLEEVLQMITAGKKSGKLEINAENRRYRIYFKNGEIVHASAPYSTGEDAIKDVFLEESGRFEFIQNIILPPKTIKKDNMNIIFQGISVREECSKIRDVFSGKAKITISSDAEKVSLNEVEWKLVKSITEGKNINEMLEKESLSYYKACKILSNILKKGLLKIT